MIYRPWWKLFGTRQWYGRSRGCVGWERESKLFRTLKIDIWRNKAETSQTSLANEREMENEKHNTWDKLLFSHKPENKLSFLPKAFFAHQLPQIRLKVGGKKSPPTGIIASETRFSSWQLFEAIIAQSNILIRVQLKAHFRSMRRHVYPLAKRQADYVCLTEEDYGASSDVTDAHALIFYYHNQWRILDVQESWNAPISVDSGNRMKDMTEFAELIWNKLGLFLTRKETVVWRRLSQNCVHCMNMKRFNLLSLQSILHELIKSTSSRFNSERSEGSFTWQVWSRVLFEFGAGEVFLVNGNFCHCKVLLLAFLSSVYYSTVPRTHFKPF